MGVMSSPRRRRRFFWAAGIVGAVALVLIVNALLPSRGGPVRVSPTERGGVPFTSHDAAEEAAASRAAAVVQPLATRFVDELVRRHDLGRAFAALAPRLRDRYSLLDWQAGRDLPLTGTSSSTGGASVAFSGRTTVGFVAALSPDVLFAVRFDKLDTLGWRVAYMHQGHSSSYVTEANYSPAGFTPGSRRETVGTWLILVGGLVGLIAAVALIDRRLG